MIGLGEIIQVKRKELGLTQERLAEKIGKTAGYIGQIERAQLSILSGFYYS